MINFYDPKRSISKLQLALCAGVCPRAFAYYLESRREILEAMGVSVIAKKLPPEAVKYVCEDYCIDLPPHLQDQEALAKAPEYLRKAIISRQKGPYPANELSECSTFVSSKDIGYVG